MDRRTFAKAVGLTLSAGVASQSFAGEDANKKGAPMNEKVTSKPEGGAMPAASGDPFRIGMVIYDNMTTLDFMAPADMFARIRAAKVHILAKTREPIKDDIGMRITPDMALSEAPDLDLLFIGGGPGSAAMMEDPEVIDFFAKRAPRAKWITSVCTGALVLGAAGLLRGYKATTHWTAMDVLPVLGAEPVYERVVFDRNRVTGGGVTAGLDFGLALVAQLFGKNMAEMIQLGEEYNPNPPFNSGSPKTASPDQVEHFQGMWRRQTEARLEAARRMSQKFA